MSLHHLSTKCLKFIGDSDFHHNKLIFHAHILYNNFIINFSA